MFNRCLTVYIPHAKQVRIDSKLNYLLTKRLVTDFLLIIL